MTILNLHGELGRKLTIEVHGYERDAPQDPYDANWLRCSAEAELGRFRGVVDASFTTQDFTRFLSELDQALNGATFVASFQTMEEALSFRIEVDRGGRAIVSGKLREIDVGGSALSFAFETDLSFLERARSDLRQVVSDFPERGG